jgi:hypothetical protein
MPNSVDRSGVAQILELRALFQSIGDYIAITILR